MKALIAGLGLIGGSLAKAMAAHTDYEIIGFDRNLSVVRQALSDGSIHAAFLPEDIHEVDFLFVALRPGDAIRFLTAAIPAMKTGAMALDLCGVKRCVVQAVDPVARERGVRFVAHTRWPGASERVRGIPMLLFSERAADPYTAGWKEERRDRRTHRAGHSDRFGRTVVTRRGNTTDHRLTSQLAHAASSA